MTVFNKQGLTDAVSDANIALPGTNFGTSPLIKASTPELVYVAKPKLESPGTKADTGQPTFATPKEALDSLEAWNENILNGVQQSSYSIRFYITEDIPMMVSTAKTYQDFINQINSRRQTTIAATGVTGINITGLSITAAGGPNAATRGMAASQLTMTLVEPLGVNLLDQMADAALELKVRNFTKAQFYVEVLFHGYNNGEIVTNVCKDGFSNNGIWVYQVVIQNIASELDSSGSKYTITMIPSQERLYEESTLRLPEAITVTASTVGEMLEGVAKQWNTCIEESYGFARTTYKFKFYTVEGRNGQQVDIRSAKLTAKQEKYSTKRAYSMDVVDGTNGTIRAHFPRGMILSDLVEMVLANSDTVQKLGMDVTTTEEFNGEIKKDPKANMRECIIFRTEATFDLQGNANGNDCYDYSNDDYLIAYNLHVLPYYTQVPILDHQDVVTSNDAKVQAQNGINLRKNGYLAKRYDYIFTGLNTEVTHVDIKFNFKWQANLPRILGQGTSQEALTTNDKKGIDYADLQRKQLAGLKNANEVLRKRREADEDINSQYAQAKQLSAAGKQQEADAVKAKADSAKSAYDNDKVGLAAETAAKQTKAILLNEKDPNSLKNVHIKVQQDRIKQRDAIPTRDAKHQFGEDVLLDPETRNKYLPISFIQDNADSKSRVSGVMDDYYTNDRSIYGATLDQLYGPMSDGMQKIVMDIRGDPYWMGMSNLERIYRIDSMAPLSVVRSMGNDPTFDIGRPDYSKGDVMFMLTYKYPHGYDDTGAPIMKTNDFFTGIYYVRQVTHKFEHGMFSQKLEANRMPLIDVYKAFGYRSTDDIAADKAAKAKVEEASQKARAAK